MIARSSHARAAGLVLVTCATSSALACDVEDLDAHPEGAEALVADDDVDAGALVADDVDAEDAGEADGPVDPGEPLSLGLARDFAFTLGGWLFLGQASVDDEDGTSLSTSGDGATCFLAGVGGDLAEGSEIHYYGGLYGLQSQASVRLYPGGYRVIAHGGAYSGTQFETWPIFEGTAVHAQGVCVFNGSNVQNEEWESESGAVAAPVKIADLGTRRQCFLSGIWGVGGAGWENSTTFARIRKITVADASHPTTGWYVESNTTSLAGHGDHSVVEGRCVDFPVGTVIDPPQTVSGSGIVPGIAPITSGTGIKACGLTSIQGAFNSSNANNGALLTAPAQVDGNWVATVSPGKSATFVCIR